MATRSAQDRSRSIADAARGLDIPVGVCGESAANPLLSIVFAGLGINSVSVAPSAVDDVNTALSAIDIGAAEKLHQLHWRRARRARGRGRRSRTLFLDVIGVVWVD